MITLVRRKEKTYTRRGAVAALVVISLVVLVGMASLTIDVGMIYRARSEAQAAADAAALAAAMELADKGKLMGNPDMSDEIERARAAAAQYAGMHTILNDGVSLNSEASGGDIFVGYLENPYDPTEPMSFSDPNRFNTVRVVVRRDGSQNDTIPLTFAGIFGLSETRVEAEAFAVFDNGNTNGVAPNGNTGPSTLLPFAFSEALWTQLLAGTFTTGDNYAFDEATGTVSAGADGILEVNMYPGAGPTQLPPGNFGTIDIGNNNNSTADLSRQIAEGVSDVDLTPYGGELTFEDGPFQLNGDTGLSAGIKDELTDIIGDARTVLLFDFVSGNGNNAMYNITDMTGIRVLAVNLTGAMTQKYVIIQPAYVVDESATSGAGAGLVFRPLELVR